MSEARRQRVGLYGGAFDPPHNAHVALARAAVEQLQLDVLYVLPTGQPWMKQRRLSDAAHRLALARLAFAAVPRVLVDDSELRRKGVTYTIDTLRELQARPAHAAQATDWYLVMGQDLLQTLPQWQRAEDLLRAVTVAVLMRPDDAGEEPRPLEPPPGVRVVPLHLPVSAISATQIRQGLLQRAALAPQERLAWLQNLVPGSVAQYIETHQLYLMPMQTETPAPSSVKRVLQKLQRAIVDGLEDVKAQDIQVFDTGHLSPLFERVIVATGNSNRQTRALAAGVRDAVREAGFEKPRMEGEENGEWIIVDCGAAVVHIMQPAIRQYYTLEEIWGDKPVRVRLGKAAAKKPAVARASAQSAAEKKMPRTTKAATRKEGVAVAEGVQAQKPARKAVADKQSPASSAQKNA